MGTEAAAPRSRRALLAAAAGAAGALAAQAALPLAAAAADDDPVVVGGEYDSSSVTSITQSAGGSVAFKARTTNADAAALVGSSGDETFMPTDTSYTGTFGWAAVAGDDGVGTGVWGMSEEFGVYGEGSVGVYGYGYNGVIGESGDATTPAIVAYGYSSSSPALEVNGKFKFNRSGRKSMSSGKSSLVISLAGVTTSSKVFAVLATSESGRYVRAVVPAAGKFTVYLNTTLSSSAVVAYFVID